MYPVEICRHILAEINLLNRLAAKFIPLIKKARARRVRSYLVPMSSQRAVSEEAVAEQGTQWGCTVFDAIFDFFFVCFML